MARFGLVRFGLVRFGLAKFGLVRFGLANRGVWQIPGQLKGKHPAKRDAFLLRAKFVMVVDRVAERPSVSLFVWLPERSEGSGATANLT